MDTFIPDCLGITQYSLLLVLSTMLSTYVAILLGAQSEIPSVIRGRNPWRRQYAYLAQVILVNLVPLVGHAAIGLWMKLDENVQSSIDDRLLDKVDCVIAALSYLSYSICA